VSADRRSGGSRCPACTAGCEPSPPRPDTWGRRPSRCRSRRARRSGRDRCRDRRPP
jgi:hypothetical protein